MKSAIPQVMYDRLSALLDVDDRDRDTMIDGLGLSKADESTLRGLLLEATSTSVFDSGVGSLFPTLAGIKPPELDGFEIIRELGRGGMGVVYLAQDTELKRYVALKFIRSGFVERDDPRLLEEARTVAKLDHHGIVNVHQLGRYDGGVFIASAYIEGETLRDTIERVRVENSIPDDSTTPLPRLSPVNARTRIDKSLGIIRDVANAMEYSHRHGVIHRDLKPSNILLNEHGTPFVTDFGIAGSATDPGAHAGPIGTLQYMSPEQAGAIRAPIGASSDVYSLGIILFELLTLRKPYEATTLVDLLRWFEKHTVVDPRRLNPAIPDAIAAICRRATAISPDKRYPDAGALMTALDLALARTLAPSRVKHVLRTRPLLSGCALIAATAILTASVIAIAPQTAPSGSIRFGQGPVEILSVRPIDNRTRLPGPSISSPTQSSSLTLPAGWYRIVLRDGAQTHEYTRLVIAGEQLQIEPPVLQQGLDLQEMVFVQGGAYLVGYARSPIPEMKPTVVEIEPFFIDKYEVTNGEYRHFVEQTGHAAPPHWPAPYQPALDPLPVVGVSQYDARAYAEWAGKRLPTDAEWEIAASGESGRPYPWQGENPVDLESVQLNASNNACTIASFNDADTIDAYLGGVHPSRAGTVPIDQTDTGVCNLAGNVAEWTDSVLAPLGAASAAVLGIVKGNAFIMSESSLFTNQQAMLQGASAGTLGTGFRCAASVSSLE